MAEEKRSGRTVSLRLTPNDDGLFEEVGLSETGAVVVVGMLKPQQL